MHESRSCSGLKWTKQLKPKKYQGRKLYEYYCIDLHKKAE